MESHESDGLCGGDSLRVKVKLDPIDRLVRQEQYSLLQSPAYAGESGSEGPAAAQVGRGRRGMGTIPRTWSADVRDRSVRPGVRDVAGVRVCGECTISHTWSVGLESEGLD